MLNTIFDCSIAIMMFLCFFSLSANMSANLYDQAKEIGVLRSIGMERGRVRLLFFYEATVLVLASCLVGIFVGTVVGFTMVLQQGLFLSIPNLFFFPWKQTFEILGISIICTFLATFGPSSQLLSKSIADIFRIM